MSDIDLVSPFIKWLLQSDYIKSNRLFLNAISAQDGSVQIITQQIPDNQVKRFIDGSKAYPITFSINSFKTVSYDQLIKTMVEGSENIEGLLDVQKIVEFVKTMDADGNYPAFADNITVERIYCQYNTPSTPTVDSSYSPALAKFTMPIVCEVFEDAE